MTLGDRGNDVEELQKFLLSNGYLNNSEENYGVLTKRAVIEVQKDLGLQPTGDWSETYYLLWKLKVKPNISLFAGEDEEKDEVSDALAGTPDEDKTVVKKEYPKGRSTFTYDKISCYVYNINTSTIIQFGVSTPEEISDSNTANFEDQAVKGRSSPFKAYDSSGPRNISFTVELVADYCTEGIVQTVHKLQALCYPHKQTVIVEPRCRFIVGTFLRVTCVPVSVDVTWKKPYKDGIYTMADVTISLSEVEEIGSFAEEVEG